MSFRIVSYYLIQPRLELAEWLRPRTEPDVVDLLTGRQLVTNDEFVGRTFWRDEENLLRVKLLFVANLRDFIPLKDDESCEAILGSREISVSLFDRWWTIEALELEGNVNDFMGQLQRSLPSVQPTGNSVVDEWLRELKNKRA